MDNKKIGKLIADLRKAKNLTQQDLGDMVGVGFRAVSKWERGITMPDISIINELSKILGITSDELLSGETKKETTKPQENRKISNKIKITISIITVIILIITSTIIYFQNKTYVYEITPTDGANYHIEGQVTFQKKKVSVIVNKLRIKEEEIQITKIKEYEYELYNGNNYIFGYGKNPDNDNLEHPYTIEEILSTFKINYNEEIGINRKEILKNKFLLKLAFKDKNNNIIIEKIEFTLY